MDDFAGRVGRFEGDVKEQFDKVDQHFDRFKAGVDQHFDRFKAGVDQRFDKVDRRFDRFEADVDRRFDRLDSKIDMTNRTIWASIFVAVMVKILFG